MSKAGIILQGGIGNRLFQVAFIYSYGKKWNKEITITKDDCNTHSSIDYHKNVYPFLPKKLYRVSSLFNEPSEKCISYMDIPDFNDCTFNGYFQCEKYFKDYKDEIQTLFQFPKQNKYIVDEYSVFIHVRRGDYVANEFHFINLSKYYEIAIEFFQKINVNFKLYVISDDILFCKNNELFKNLHSNIEYVEGLNELETISLMKACLMGGICANSTYSWWVPI
jgi:hypothetical protein